MRTITPATPAADCRGPLTSSATFSKLLNLFKRLVLGAKYVSLPFQATVFSGEASGRALGLDGGTRMRPPHGVAPLPDGEESLERKAPLPSGDTGRRPPGASQGSPHTGTEPGGTSVLAFRFPELEEQSPVMEASQSRALCSYGLS